MTKQTMVWDATPGAPIVVQNGQIVSAEILLNDVKLLRLSTYIRYMAVRKITVELED